MSASAKLRVLQKAHKAVRKGKKALVGSCCIYGKWINSSQLLCCGSGVVMLCCHKQIFGKKNIIFPYRLCKRAWQTAKSTRKFVTRRCASSLCASSVCPAFFSFVLQVATWLDNNFPVIFCVFFVCLHLLILSIYRLYFLIILILSFSI